MTRAIAVAAGLMLLGGPAWADLVDFNTAGDENKFVVFYGTGGDTWARVTPSTDPLDGTGMAQMTQYGNKNSQSRVYAPDGVNPMVVGEGPISTDLCVDADTYLGYWAYGAHLILPSDPTKPTQQYWAGIIEASYNSWYFFVGCLNGDRQWNDAGGHNGSDWQGVSLSFGTWYTISATVSSVGGLYHVDATLLDTAGNPIKSIGWTDNQAIPTNGHVGLGVNFYGDLPQGVVGSFDNFQVVPEPATMALLALGSLGLAALRRRRK